MGQCKFSPGREVSRKISHTLLREYNRGCNISVTVRASILHYYGKEKEGTKSGKENKAFEVKEQEVEAIVYRKTPHCGVFL